MSITYYQIRPLKLDELQMLQQAIVSGALRHEVETITAQIVANKDHGHIVTSLERDLASLIHAGQAIMAAKPLP